MDSVAVIVLWVALVGLIVFVVAWFGPRPSQWRTHGGDPVEADDADPGGEEAPDDEAGETRAAGSG